MSTDSSQMSSHTSFSEFVSTHESLLIGGGIVLVLVLAGAFMSSKNRSMPATSATSVGGSPDLSGLTNGLVYVPTQTNFTTENYKQSGVFASNDPNLTTITGPVNSPTTTTSHPIVPPSGGPIILPPSQPPIAPPAKLPTGPVPPPVIRQPPPVLLPPATSKALIWDQSYTIKSGDSLSLIAANLTRTLRAQGMPGSITLTWNDLYGHNTATVNSWSAKMGMPVKVGFGPTDPAGPWNNVFSGEIITVPRWG